MMHTKHISNNVVEKGITADRARTEQNKTPFDKNDNIGCVHTDINYHACVRIHDINTILDSRTKILVFGKFPITKHREISANTTCKIF